LGTIYASFGVIGIEWVLLMHPSEFQKSRIFQDFSTLALIHIKKFIKPQIIINNGILVSPSIV
jgi:hypothetical protein